MVNNFIYNPVARAVHYNLVAHEWFGQPYEMGRITLVWERVFNLQEAWWTGPSFAT
jgi:hypothetical protein